ncbi:MAG: undecaprenyl-phosphate glucose phosphotransferase [candidate division KSB1 bacterium]|nr:undecaprenyl-phosphate glucose phosphotransferase [candidate division KSB1 bacterium]MDZ7275637.1 undecaprenyl-phosphate glucose phosphotransferase [candidate division KSB1 bacterium]MDZ7284672.1 undecaprenyl-phosphate glucose phosphotransferase [candidate division KSB1 bacterium]MDZ7297909.1 undecaprenyl-phosphate glucose phosphotransferase [candidate division KSB1 bacterium]MDZ7305963.1 undecaprenyl-phosphate glucose phosphotransferase [candidate division KSB1 bacterium]
MSQKHNRSWEIAAAVMDGATTALAFYAAFWLRFQAGFLPHANPDPGDYFIMLGGILPLWLGLFSFFGLYDFRRPTHLHADLRPLLYSIATGVVCLSAFTFFYREISYSRLTFVLFGVLNFLLTLGGRLLLRLGLRQAHRHGYHLRQVLIVGAGELGLRVAAQAKRHPELGYRVVGFCDDYETNGIYKKEYGLEVLGRTTDLDEIIEKYRIDKVIVALPGRALRKISRIVEACEQEGVETDIVPDFFKFIQPRTRVHDFAGLPLVSVRFTPVDSWKYRVGKRLFDAVFAALALIVFAPLMLVIAIAIKLTSPGPVLFKQERIGINRRPFHMLKFRSMKVGAEKVDHEVGLGLCHDPRVTRLGKFLREWSLDELPQLWNVLMGDMSLVGPRPERTYHVRQLKTRVPNYMIRHQVRTGMTGWAQVNGWRGDTSIDRRIEHDLYYIENWSFAFDLKIILLTLFGGVISKKARGL